MVEEDETRKSQLWMDFVYQIEEFRLYPSGDELMEGHPTEKSRDQICILPDSV